MNLITAGRRSLIRIATAKVLLFICAAAAFAVPTKPASPPPAGHPLVGKWQWTRERNHCTEVYDFRADGTAWITSGAERADNTYTVSLFPDANGFYRLTLTTTKDYGGKDCADIDSDSTDEKSTTFIQFSPDRTMYLICEEAKLEKCFGPLRRFPAQQ